MKDRGTLAFGLILLCLIASSAVYLQPVKAQSKPLIVPDDYPTISSAVGNATDGVTILVRSGTYQENVLEINKSISLIGENANTTKIFFHPASQPLFGSAILVYDSPMQIRANQVKLTGFTINSDGGAIGIDGTDCSIVANDLNVQIVGTGDRTQIIRNKISASPKGIDVTGSNQLIAQNVFDNSGIICTGSLNRILNNKITIDHVSKDYGVDLSGTNNVILNNSILYGSINLKGDNNFIERNNVTAILISKSSGNTVCGNYITEILGFVGSNNTFYGNYMRGLHLGNQYYDTPNNTFYENNFDFTNGRNIGAMIGVLGSLIFDNGTIGNYWSDYQMQYPDAEDIDDSGIWNTPYTVYLAYGNNTVTAYAYVLSEKGNYAITLTDRYPLVSPFDISTIQLQLPAWANTTIPIVDSLPSFPDSDSAEPITFAAVACTLIIVIAVCLLVYFKRQRKNKL